MNYFTFNTTGEMGQFVSNKRVYSFEDEIVTESDLSDVMDSAAWIMFKDRNALETEIDVWLEKQHLLVDGKLTVAALLLFSDEPQVCLAKRSSIKILRYQTCGKATRTALVGTPITVEGCIYHQICEATKKTKEIIECIRGAQKGFELLHCQEETLHEIITNAVTHRDYKIITDIQIRIFDNRVEIESPGRLPEGIAVDSMLTTKVTRNSKIAYFINEFQDMPNTKGLSAAFKAMDNVRLQVPLIEETNSSVLVTMELKSTESRGV